MDPKTYLLILHLIGMMIGLGSVTTLDLYLVKIFRSAVVTRHDVELMHHVSRLAGLGLLLLWASGLGFLYLYWFNNPEALANPKLHAKLGIVGVLTLNGAFLHAWVLPTVDRAVGRPLFAPPTPAGDRFRLSACGAISVASWWTPFVLGAVRELNFTLSVGSFLIAYVVVLAAVAGAMAALAFALDRYGSAPPAAVAAKLPGSRTYPRVAGPLGGSPSVACRGQDAPARASAPAGE